RTHEIYTLSLHDALPIFTSPISIDGELSEPVWQQAEPVETFTQRDPDENAPPTQRTVVRLAYDDAALYVGARMYDTAPDSIFSRDRKSTRLNSSHDQISY